MKLILQRLLKFAAYLAASVVILLAIAVGLFRLFLPRLPEYQEEIKGWASAAIGMEVEFSGMDARWGLSGPELAFYETELLQPGSDLRLVAAAEVRVGIAVNRLLFDSTLVVDHVVIRDTSIELRQLENGEFRIQGRAPDELLGRRPIRKFPEFQIVGENVEIIFLQPGDERPHFFEVRRATAGIDEHRVVFDAVARLPADLGRELDISATRLLDVAGVDRWDIDIDGSDLRLDGLSALQTSDAHRLLSGQGDVELSLAWEGGRVSKATAAIDLASVSLAEGSEFDVEGRFELETAADSWLVAAEGLQIATGGRQWPESRIRAEAVVDPDGSIVMIDLRASYLNLDDIGLFQPWLPEDIRNWLGEASPSGTIHDLGATVSDIGEARPNFDITVDLDNAGISALDGFPGLRGFSGEVHANRSGGRIEIRSEAMQLDLPKILDKPVDVGLVTGTILWRRSNNRTTIMSDSVHIRNEVLDTRSNIQLTLGDDGASPEIDLVSTFSIDDVGAARAYIPRNIMKQRLYDWFQMSLVSGSIPRGSLRLNGPLDKFPFDGGEGRLLVEGSVRDLTFKYQPQWPAAEQADIEVVFDNTRLYTVRNRSTHAGNEAVDAMVEIADVRNPVLRIEALVTGTLESLRQFGLQSPVNEVLGGNLERVAVAGDASFNLDLVVPLKDSKNFGITGLLRSNNGTLTVHGFAPPVTDIIGEVTITRDTVTSETLGASFLGEPIEVVIGPDDDAHFMAVATATGHVGAAALVNDLGVPLEGLVTGGTSYLARLKFPRGQVDDPAPFTIEVESDLAGLGLDLPEPVRKSADSTLGFSGALRFLPGGEVIQSSGNTENDISWDIAFTRADESWDFDRGIVSKGMPITESAETRGLHIRGVAETLRLEDWLDLSRSGPAKTGAAERIRSIDLTVADLYAVGQHLENHRVRVDRSASDWLVQVSGDDITGSIFVPYDFGSDREMVLEMDRLRLPGDDTAEPSATSPDPRKLPPITVTAGEFALGDRYFGAVEARLERRDDGLEATKILARDQTFEVVGNGRWVVDPSDPMGSHSYLTATLNSSDVEATLTRLDFAPGIVSDEMGLVFDLNWSGGPRGDFLDVLDGNVRVRLADGQLREVEPGAGRVFGLMSFAALPRRLALDFRDVFNKGFRFDDIAGTFRIEDGIAHTCDLSLAGPAADIGIVGRTDLVDRQYEQAAVVSANVGSTLPIVGAVVGGPPGAAAMLIFSQLFRKPLKEVGQVYYVMNGSWDEPAVESTSSENFVRYGQLAGCLDTAQ